MPRSAKPDADAALLMIAIDRVGASPEAKAYLWVGLDLALNQREIGAALMGQLEAWMDKYQALDEMREMLRLLREPAWPADSSQGGGAL